MQKIPSRRPHHERYYFLHVGADGGMGIYL
jgi:hypothetical protein